MPFLNFVFFCLVDYCILTTMSDNYLESSLLLPDLIFYTINIKMRWSTKTEYSLTLRETQRMRQFKVIKDIPLMSWLNKYTKSNKKNYPFPVVVKFNILGTVRIYKKSSQDLQNFEIGTRSHNRCNRAVCSRICCCSCQISHKNPDSPLDGAVILPLSIVVCKTSSHKVD